MLYYITSKIINIFCQYVMANIVIYKRKYLFTIITDDARRSKFQQYNR